MFRLISLNINDWNYLGHIPENKLIFIPDEEIKKSKLPYTTVLIGPNGTGKSTLLAYLGRIFEDLSYMKEKGKRNINAIAFPYKISYQIAKTKFTISQQQRGLDQESTKRTLKWTYNITKNQEHSPIPLAEVILPEQIIAVSYLPMDRFRQKKNFPGDYYQYLGLRHRSNAASPQYFLNNTLPLLFSYISKSRSVRFLKDILSFMGLDQNYLGIQLEYRYKQFFFTGRLTETSFEALFNDPSLYSKRAGHSFAVEYYDRYIKNDQPLLQKIVSYLNIRTLQDHISFGERSVLEFDLFENLELLDELSLIHHLQKLDLLTSASLLFKKSRGSSISSSGLSSGEFHFLATMIAIQSTLKENSLILIDEPDTSLHPNWQMKYVDQLKRLFENYNSCHFIMATHSHFIISDLENESSEIIGLKGQVPNIEAKSFNVRTYGCSAEEILLEIFELPTTRNHFVYEKVGEILEMIAIRDVSSENQHSNDFSALISQKIEHLKLKGIDKLSIEDPLKDIIDKIITKYGRPN